MTAPTSEAWTRFLRDQAERQAQSEQLTAAEHDGRPAQVRTETARAGSDQQAGHAQVRGR